MKRSLLAAAVATAPLLAAMLLGPGPGRAETTITTSTTTPVKTSTAAAGHPDDVTITGSGSINPTIAVPAVTLDSSNTVTNEGAISFTDVSGATGIQVLGGNTGAVVVTGSITVSETYSATINSSNGLPDGPFAQGFNRIGIDVEGSAPFVGAITDTGAITVHGNTSEGMLIAAPITGNLRMFTLTGSGTSAGIVSGSMDIMGDKSFGILVAPTGSIGGDLRITAIKVQGVGSEGVEVDGRVAGTMELSGAISSTAYRNTSRPGNPALAQLYTSSQLGQGGPAVSVAADIGGGVIVSAPPPVLSSTNPDQDNNGVPDSLQGSGILATFGKAAALQVGAVGHSVTLGEVGTGDRAYGLIVQGAVAGDGVYDPFLTPNLPSLVPATGMLLGVSGGGGVTILGGIRNEGGISAQSYQADATAISMLSAVSTPTLDNSGIIRASSTQINNAPGLVPVYVTAIDIAAGSSIPDIKNSSGITANITGSGGVGGIATAIIDRSGSLSTIENTGTISAQLTQTLASNPMPGVTTAIDISKGTGPQTITQSVPEAIAGSTVYSESSTYVAGDVVTFAGSIYQATGSVAVAQDPNNSPTLWRQIGAVVPSISGSIFFGSGGSTLTVTDGIINATTIDLGAGVNTVTIDGDSTTTVSGAIKDEGGHLTLNVINGRLSDLNPNTIAANAVNVGASGVLLVAVDPANNLNTKFVTTGASTFVQGAQVGLTMESVQKETSRTYVILQTVPGQGTLSAGTFSGGELDNAPYLYTASAAYVPAADPSTQSSEIQLTVGLKNQQQLNFNNAQYAALQPILAAIPRDPKIQATILNQTTETGLKLAYDQLLPDQGQGLFDAIDAAARAVDSMIATPPDAGTRVAGTSLWLQQVNERVQRDGIQTQGSASKLFGLVAGYEKMGLGGGALGVTLAYFNTQETNTDMAVGQNVVSNLVELGAYYRRSVGGLTFAGRAAGGYSWYTGLRRFVSLQASNNAYSSWNGGYFNGHLGVDYERQFGRFYVGPSLSLDYVMLKAGTRVDHGGGTGFDLTVAPRTSTRLSVNPELVLGAQWGRGAWLRTELRAGYVEILSGSVGDTVANFAGDPSFTLLPDPYSGGWATVGLSLKGGSPYSYLAVEGDVDFRSGEQRYDLRFAGRSMF